MTGMDINRGASGCLHRVALGSLSRIQPPYKLVSPTLGYK